MIELEYGFSVATLAHKLRRFVFLHRLLKWWRSNFWHGLAVSFIELCRWFFEPCRRFGPPTGVFSVYQALRNGFPPIEGRLVLEDQGSPTITKDSLLALSPYNQHLQQPWPIFWSRHPSARLATSSLALIESKRVCIESVYGFPRLSGDPAYRFMRLPDPIKLQGNWTSLVSRWVPTRGRPNYTHWLLDALPRCALIQEFPEDTGVLVPESLFPSQEESLGLLGLLNRCRFTAETHIELEHYYFSSPTSMLECYNPFGITFLRRQFIPKADPHYSGPRKFFVARTGSVRNPKNLEELNEFFTSIGWSIIQPAELSFAQQIKLFSQAEAICGTVGSGMTNCVFCKLDCQIILLAQDFMADSWLEWISQIIGSNFHFLLCPSGYTQNIIPDIARIKDLLRRLGHTV